MNDCKRFEDVLASLIGGDSTVDQHRKAMRHIAECDECAGLFAVHSELEDLELPAASQSEFLQMRRNVLRTLRSQSAEPPPSAWWKSARVLRLRPAGLALLAAGALGIGFLLGRMPSADRAFEQARREDARLATGTQVIAGQLEFAALRNRRMEQSADSPYTFSDLQVREVDSGRVELSFDVATHLELVRDKSDPLVAEILVQSLVNPAPVGTRLEAISMVRSLEPKVRDALIVAMLEDPSLPVRMAALEKLGSQPVDPATEAAFLKVLEREESVQMRLVVIDHLAQERVSPNRLESAVLSGRPEPGRALFARTQDYFATF